VDDEDRLNELLDEWERARREGTLRTVEDLCAERPDLAPELRRRIAALEAMDAMLPSDSSLAGDSGPPAPPPIPTFLYATSTFRPVSLHARGGIGEVHVARDEQFDRQVAVKIIQKWQMDSDEDRRRFAREVEITGRLEHPGVVPVYAAGRCDDGRPYYAMKFLEGQTLREAIREVHRNGGPGGENEVEFRRLLGRFVQVCETIAYAHHRGVLHRDVKPTNVVLGRHGETVVIDWGLAKQVGEPGDPATRSVGDVDDDLTSIGMFIGTPWFMAPEQFVGDRERQGPASDIYSLGVTLYVLLTDTGPFRDYQGLIDLQDRVLRGDFPRPAQVEPRTPGPLEAICLKAMAVDPEARYPSATALAREIEHWLADEPVAAHREGPVDRLARWGRRHRPAVAASILGLVAVVVAMAVATTLIARAHVETRRALIIAETERTAARRNAEDAEESRNRAVSHSFMILHGVTEPLKRLGNPDLESQPELAAMRRRALAEAALAYELFVDSRGNGAGEQVEANNSLIHLGLIHTIAGDREKAMETYRKAIARGDAWLAANLADPGVCDSVGMAHFHLGMDLKKLGRADEAEEQFRQSDARFVQQLGLAPDEFVAQQHLCWLLAFCPDDRLRPPSRAVAEVRSLLELTEGKGRDRPSFSQGIRPKFTEGLALYRAGDWQGARAALDESCRRRDGGDAYEWFVLAMASARLEDLESARRAYDRAVEWTKWNRYGDTELHMLEAEAAPLLGRTPAFK